MNWADYQACHASTWCVLWRLNFYGTIDGSKRVPLQKDLSVTGSHAVAVATASFKDILASLARAERAACRPL